MDQSARELPSGIVTFFFSDVEGSTRLATAQGARFADTLDAHRRVVRAALQAHGGLEVSTAGDSFFAVFPEPAAAAAAAIAIEAGLPGAAAAGDADAIRVRIGLHTGQAALVGRDYVGLDVHLAARISDAGHGGQILLSEATRDAIREEVPAGSTVTDLGRHRLKDVGPQRIWQLDGPGRAPDRFPPLRSLEAHPSNLPLALSSLIDREQERAELTALIGRSSVVTVTGAGGIGKSRVALDVARSMVGSFPDGVFYVDLVGTPDASAVAEALLELMGLRSTTDSDATGTLLDRLRSRDLLLVLDTADRVSDLPRLVASVAATCPRIRVLLTSRSPLHIGAEVELALPPLAGDPAADLFITRARAVRAQPLDDRDSANAIARLVARLDGIPLAIELAAARTKVFTPAALLDRIERRLPSLGQGSVDLPNRQRTLRDTISWSCELLRPAEQAAFRQLGVFAGSVDLDAVEAVVLPDDGEDAASLLEALVDRSLVVAESSDGAGPRFRLLAPIREFAEDALRAGSDADTVRERHARHWIAFTAELLGDQGQPGLDEVLAIDANEPDIRAALEWACATEAGRPDLAVELAGLLGRYWWLRGRVVEGLQWLDRAISTDGGAGAAGVGRLDRALFWAGVLLDDAGRPTEAMVRLEACLKLQRAAGDDRGVARTLNSLGVVARSLGDLDRAQALLEESIHRKRAIGDRAGIPTSLSNLGVVASDRGEYDEAVRYMSEALEIDEELGAGAEILSHSNLGLSLIRAGRYAEGLTHLRLALPGVVGLGDPERVVELLTGLVRVSLASPGDDAARGAARLLFAAEAVRRREDLPINATEVAEHDELLAAVLARITDAELAPFRAEATTIDADAALLLVREALDTTEA